MDDGASDTTAQSIELPAVPNWGQVKVNVEMRGDEARSVVLISGLPTDQPSRFEGVGFEGASFHNVNLSGATFSDPIFTDIDIWAWGRNLSTGIDGLRINGVEIQPLLEAELDRLFPERAALRDIADIDGLLAASDAVDDMWRPTIERARALGKDALNMRVGDGFSFTETLRHLVFGFDAWVRRVAFRESEPYHALALAYPDDRGTRSADGMVPWSTVGIDIDLRPTLDEVIAARDENATYFREKVATLTNEDLQRVGDAIVEPGYPFGKQSLRAVGDCLRSRMNEEWWHHQYAIRDLTVLEAG